MGERLIYFVVPEMHLKHCKGATNNLCFPQIHPEIIHYICLKTDHSSVSLGDSKTPTCMATLQCLGCKPSVFTRINLCSLLSTPRSLKYNKARRYDRCCSVNWDIKNPFCAVWQCKRIHRIYCTRNLVECPH